MDGYARPASIYILCGFVGSGKTTFAQRVEAETGAVRFTLDEWLIPLFGERMSREEMDRRISFFEAHFKELAVRLLHRGVDVIFDFGFWKRAQRDEIRAWARSIDAEVKMVHFSADLSECKRRVLARGEIPGGAFTIDEDTFDALAKNYEPPGADEQFSQTVG